MMLVVDNYKAFIGRESERFKLLIGDEKEEHSAEEVSQIVVIRASSISFGAIRLAMENNIDIVYLGRRGEPHARVYPCKLGGTTLTRRKQLEISVSEGGINLSKWFISAKIKNQASLLRSLGKSRGNQNLLDAAKMVGRNVAAVELLTGSSESVKHQLLGFEGNASAIYFGALSGILPFAGRDRNAGDAVNIFLNYGYGMLYSEAERACIIAGLDPYLGFLHADRYGKPSMVLDIVEEFRQPIVDRTVITLFSHKQAEKDDLEQNGKSVVLSEKGRKKIIAAIAERLGQKVTYNGKQLTFKEIIVEQARNVVRFIIGQNPRYDGFTSRW